VVLSYTQMFFEGVGNNQNCWFFDSPSPNTQNWQFINKIKEPPTQQCALQNLLIFLLLLLFSGCDFNSVLKEVGAGVKN
jgi:hypothetical protein